MKWLKRLSVALIVATLYIIVAIIALPIILGMIGGAVCGLKREGKLRLPKRLEA